MTGILDFYTELYTSNHISDVNECLAVLPTLVTEAMNTALMAPISAFEVEKVAFSMGSLKAPGPYGFNGLFYQKNWDTLKEDITNLVKQFFETGHLEPKFNSTIVALVPKVPMPKSIAQLRPISCCNYVYKIISKVMVNRLKPYMNDMVSPQKSAFVGGRLIQDNLVVAHEAFHFPRKNTTAGVEVWH